MGENQVTNYDRNIEFADQLIERLVSHLEQSVRESDRDEATKRVLLDARRALTGTTPTMYKGEVAMASGKPITEPNNVTRMLDQAYALGYTVRVPDPDADVGKLGARCADAREAWGKVIEHHMEVDDDFFVQFEKPGEPVHWMFFVTGGGNMPDDGWMNDGCASHDGQDCTALEPLWDAMQ